MNSLKPKEGEFWGAGDGKIFQIISVVEVNGKSWVYYRDAGHRYGYSVQEPREYSCYEESFVYRFKPEVT